MVFLAFPQKDFATIVDSLSHVKFTISFIREMVVEDRALARATPHKGPSFTP
jgi:hypothetical protein